MFTAGTPRALQLFCITCLSVALMVWDNQYPHLQQARATLSVLVSPLRLIAELPVIASLSLQNWLTTRHQLQDENTTLHQHNLQLQARLQKYMMLQAENQHLRELLGSSTELPSERMLIAQLSSIDLDPHQQQVIINKGTRDGAFVGQPVLDAAAVMGQIKRTTPFSATVLLITDANHALPVQIVRNGLRTIAVGTGRIDALELPYLPDHTDIQVGDQLVTSGLGGTFPAGYPVATVTQIDQRPNQMFAYIKAEPLAYLDRSREVLLVWEDKTMLAQHTP
ncbi:MAG: rod shape-determining protein MreC [Pseudomonadota bacterium]